MSSKQKHLCATCIGLCKAIAKFTLTAATYSALMLAVSFERIRYILYMTTIILYFFSPAYNCTNKLANVVHVDLSSEDHLSTS